MIAVFFYFGDDYIILNQKSENIVKCGEQSGAEHQSCQHKSYYSAYNIAILLFGFFVHINTYTRL